MLNIKSLPKLILYTLLTFLIFPIFPKPTQANTDFHTQMQNSYIINDQGVANVTQHIGITNKKSNIYATEYTLNIASDRIKNIKIESINGRLIPFTTDAIDGSTRILITFDDKIVGVDQTQEFYVSYINIDVSQYNGNILELTIPKISNPQEIDDYKVTISVPAAFSIPTAVSPVKYTLEKEPAVTILTFTSKKSLENGISVVFGDRQTYDAKINYHLQNTGITPIDTQIALPPDTLFQRVFIRSIEPEPLMVNTDMDGNWIASYHLEPKSELHISYHATIQTYISKRKDFTQQFSDLKDYLKPLPYWDSDAEIVKTFSQSNSSASEIYQFTIDRLSYGYTRIDNNTTNRLGASQAINNPKDSLCLEYSDTFIALARASGIPARMHTGYAHTQNNILRPLGLIKDVLHAWPEYFDFETQNWLPIDPTWGDTTGGADYFNQFDVNHITLAIHGLSSEKPYPAGFYKSEQENGKDIDIVISNTTPLQEIKFDSSLSQPSPLTLGNSLHYELIIKNLSNTALYNAPITITSSEGDVYVQSNSIPILVPYSDITIPFTLNSSTKKENLITIKIYDQEQSHIINARNNLLYTIIILSLSTSLVYLLAKGTQKLRRILVSR